MSACTRSAKPVAKSPPATPSVSSSELAPAFPVTVTDQTGTEVRLETSPQRIVSLAPAHTELLFALGAGDRVEGVTTYCTVPVEAQSREKVGGFVGSSISVERVLALKPDLVLSNGVIQEELRQALRNLKLTVIDYDPKSIAELRTTIEDIAACVGTRSKGQQMLADLDARLAKIRSKVTSIKQRPRTLYVVWDEPLRTVGGQSYLTEVLREAGADVMFADLPAQYPSVSLETVLKRDPEVIFLPRTHEVTPEEMARRPGWDLTSAVRNKRVYTIDDDLTARCGPRLVDAIEMFYGHLHPQAEAAP